MKGSISHIFGKKVVYCDAGWVLVYSKNSLSSTLEDMIKIHYGVKHITVVLKES